MLIYSYTLIDAKVGLVVEIRPISSNSIHTLSSYEQSKII